ncbi:hypothetical protein CMI47_14165 [Candidatus Pacearchaeota archaeon]|nr:hypothetical protein [Candidatus Pacearchaeota archaeon]
MTVYQPAEDSYFLQVQVKKLSKNKSVIDIGSGGGIQSLSALKSGASSVLATDIDPVSIKHLKSLNIPVLKSNLFEKIKGKFDLIIFNPPYLPQDKCEPKESQKATTGGKRGDEIILKFLKQAQKHLNKNGSILLLLSSQTPTARIFPLITALGLHKKLLSKKKLFFETLYVYQIQ